MKRRKRILATAAAMAAAMSLSACSSGTAAETTGAQIESTAEDAATAKSGSTAEDASTAKSGSTAEDASGSGKQDQTKESGVGSTRIEYSSENATAIEIFDEGQNYNPVVYGPPEEMINHKN
ncbi:MAG TPA: hypothetical protein DCF49_04970 [Lachnospiraceae bacterium]|nr:hypothetical protein [Lachnospiraceae bacterium]